jgi:uncharacterized membrane protein YkvA (DUF1232 family)
MPGIFRRITTSAAFATFGCVFVAVTLSSCSPAAAGQTVPGPIGALFTVAFDDQPIERQIGTLTKTVFREIRRSFRMLRWMFWRAMDWWGGWIRRATFSFTVAILALLADRSLIAAWQSQGLRALVTNAALMLYVYARLLFSGKVPIAPKLLLLGALVYGVVPSDLMPDRRFWPGQLEDLLLIVIAVRAFVYACPEESVNEYAERAVTLKRRLVGAG